MKILDRYIYKKLFLYTMVILPSAAFVSALVELIELFRKIKVFDIKLVFLYVLNKLPEKFYIVLPISIIIVIALFARDLIKRNEIYPILLNGISLKKLSVRFFIFSLLFSVFQLVNLEFVLPKTNLKAEKIYKILRKKEDLLKQKLVAFNTWISIDENTMMYFDVLDLNSKTGKNGILIKLDKEFKPVLRIEGKTFHVFNSKILFLNGKIVDLKNIFNFSVAPFKKYPLFINLNIEDFRELIEVKKPISLKQLYKTAKVAEKYGYPASYYWSRFFQKLSTVFSPLILALFVYPFIWSKNLKYISIILGAVVFYWYGIGFLTSLSEGNVIPYYGVFIVDLIYVVLGIFFLRKLSFHEF